jgi:ribosomal protein S14
MKRIVIWDSKKRYNYLLSETKIKMLKSLISDTWVESIDRIKASYILNRKFKNFSKSKIVNWCIVTGWGHSVLRPFALSWMQFKEFAQQGLFPGVKRRNY